MKANDPRALRARVIDLEKQLAARASAALTTKQPKPAKIVQLDPKRADKMIERLQDVSSQLGADAEAVLKRVEGIRAETDRTIMAILVKMTRPTALTQLPPMPSQSTLIKMPPPTGAPMRMRKVALVDNGDGTVTWRESKPRTDGAIPRIQRSMLTALAERPEGLTLKKLRIATGYADSGPTSAAIRALVTNGWAIKERELLIVTNAGLQALGPFTPLPKGDALRAMLLSGSRLNTAEKNMLTVICDAWPQSLTREEIRARAGYSDSGPTSAAMRKLVNLDYVIDEGRAGLLADNALFDAGGAQ
jgi:hypothetical protein